MSRGVPRISSFHKPPSRRPVPSSTACCAYQSVLHCRRQFPCGRTVWHHRFEWPTVQAISDTDSADPRRLKDALFRIVFFPRGSPNTNNAIRMVTTSANCTWWNRWSFDLSNPNCAEPVWTTTTWRRRYGASVAGAAWSSDRSRRGCSGRFTARAPVARFAASAASPGDVLLFGPRNPPGWTTPTDLCNTAHITRTGAHPHAWPAGDR